MTKKGVKIQNFKKSKKVPLDILEIHVVSKFCPIPMKIAAGRLSDADNEIKNQKSYSSYQTVKKFNGISQR